MTQTAFTAAQKDELREAFLISRREALAESRRLASLPRSAVTPPVAPAVEPERRAEPAPVRQLTKQVIDEKPRRQFHTCAYCGAHCFGYACEACRDLPQIEHQLYSQSNEVAAPLSPGSATTSQQTGA